MPSLIVFRSSVKYDHLSLHLPLVVQPTQLPGDVVDDALVKGDTFTRNVDFSIC
jgi:hypothetical protein